MRSPAKSLFKVRSAFNRVFTLIELLLVVGLMALLMGIALPAFSKMAKGGGVTIASRNLSAKINAARSYAAAKRVYTAVVFPINDNVTTNNIPASLRCSYYRVALVSRSGSTNTFVNWVDGENWEKMPSGTFFNGQTSPTTLAAAGSATISNADTVLGCDFQDVGNATTAKLTEVDNCLVFTPSGGTTKDLPFGIAIWEGTVTSVSATGTPSITATNWNSGTSTGNFVKINVNPFTGKISYTNM